MSEKEKKHTKYTSYLTKIPIQTINLLDYESIKNHLKSIRLWTGIKKDKDYYLALGDHFTKLLKEFGFFYKISLSLKKEGIYLYMNSQNKYANVSTFFEEGKQLDFTSKSAKEERELEDIIVNVMYLANKLAHVFDMNDFPKLESEIDGISDMFYDIKDGCIEELLNLKREGKPILIGHEVDDKHTKRMRNVYYFALPYYTKVFSMHADNEYCFNYDDIICFKKFILHDLNGGAIPVKIDHEDYEKLKNKSHKEGFYKSVKEEIRPRIKVFLEIQGFFKKQKSKKNKNESELSEEENKIIKGIATNFYSGLKDTKKRLKGVRKQLQNTRFVIEGKRLGEKPLDEKRRKESRLQSQVNKYEFELEKKQKIMKMLRWRRKRNDY